ncbi:type II secretion system F family protein, partial [bacterium]|nr:type II secretion system F family protein [bacterium]
FSGVAAIFAYNLPGMAAKRKYKRMFALFGEQLIDSFGFLRNSLQAGSSLSQALQIMVDQSSPPLSEEFEEVLKKNQFGVPLDKALNELDAKMGNKDLHLGILAMNVTREYGGNLSEILKRVVDVMRDRMRIAKKIDSITAQGKLSGWIITAIPFFLIVVLTLLQPELFGMMFTTVLGNVMLGVAVLFVTVGNIVIQKVVAINI